MSATETAARPLVFATRRALARAERLLPGRVLETEVHAAIASGQISRRRPRGDALVFGPTWIATVRRVESPAGSGRKAWRVVDVDAYDPSAWRL